MVKLGRTVVLQTLHTMGQMDKQNVNGSRGSWVSTVNHLTQGMNL